MPNGLGLNPALVIMQKLAEVSFLMVINVSEIGKKTCHSEDLEGNQASAAVKNG